MIKNLSYFLLFLFVLAFGAIMASLDPFLHIWDEAFHALVAKRMSVDPFHPQLYTTILREHDLENWADTQTWLHKQPFFLWLIAISLKVFGNSALAVRLPSVLAHAFTSIFIARIGARVSNHSVGLAAGMLFGLSHFAVGLMTGNYHTDHNDTIFLFLVTGSFWAWFNFQSRKSMGWAIAIGLFAGMAVLTKWLTGMVVFGGWFVSLLFHPSWKDEWKPMLVALITSIAVFLPWQIYIFQRFPTQAAHEYAYNSMHLTTAVEGHSGDWFYHFDMIKQFYFPGDLMWIVMLVALVYLLVRLDFRKRLFVASIVLAVFTVFTIAKTKMPAFTIILSSFFWIAFAQLVYQIIEKGSRGNLQLRTWAFIAVSMIAAYFAFDLERTTQLHSIDAPETNDNRAAHLKEIDFITYMKLDMQDSKVAVFNADLTYRGNLGFMFYRDFAVAYSELPTPEIIDQAISLNLLPVVIQKGGNPLPMWIQENPKIKVLKFN